MHLLGKVVATCYHLTINYIVVIYCTDAQCADETYYLEVSGNKFPCVPELRYARQKWEPDARSWDRRTDKCSFSDCFTAALKLPKNAIFQSVLFWTTCDSLKVAASMRAGEGIVPVKSSSYEETCNTWGALGSFLHVCQPSSMSVWIKAPLLAHSPITWPPLLPYASICQFIHIPTRLRRVRVCQLRTGCFGALYFSLLDESRLRSMALKLRISWTIINAIGFDQAMWEHSCSLMQHA